ncbi:MAG: glycosyltransferase family 4 protein [Acidobacteria bacterium]|nr:glycosyltransferase family 4 protein [Acidobacteriota bacterium]
MRICHVSPHLPPDQAANALLPAHLGRWAHQAGHDVAFVTQGKARAGTGAGRDEHGVVRETRPRSASPVLRALRIDTLLRSRSIAASLDEVATGADIVHLHSNGLIIEIASAWAHRRRIPVVLTLYGTEIWHYRRRWPIDPFTRAYRQANAVTFYSQKLLDRARELGLDRPDLSVIYPPVSAAFGRADEAARTSLRAALGIVEPHMILNVKRLHPLAGQRHLIDAFAALARDRDDVRLVICGTGELRAELEARAGAAGVAGKVTFAGLVPNDVVANYAAVADVFALPSELEALPTVAVEALAAGTPVVSTDHPGGVELHALFGDDVQVVPRGDVAGLTRLLTAAIGSPRRTRESTAALVRDRFGPDAVRDAYLALYARLLTR